MSVITWLLISSHFWLKDSHFEYYFTEPWILLSFFFCLFCYHSLKSINFCSGKLLGDQLDHFKACLYALL